MPLPHPFRCANITQESGKFSICTIDNGLNLMQMDSFWQYIVKGIVILIAVYMDFVKSKKLQKGK